MKNIFVITVILLFPVSQVFAHEGGEFTDVAGSDWISPLIAIFIIAGAIILARIIRKGSNRPISEIINNNH